MGSIQKYRNKQKKIFGDFINQNEESLSIIKRIKTLVYIDPKYVFRQVNIHDWNYNKFMIIPLIILANHIIMF